MVRLALALLLVGCVGPLHGAPAYSAQTEPVAEAAPMVIHIGDITSEDLFYPTLFLAAATGPVTFVIDSPGGSVSAGLRFVDSMRLAQARGVVISCIVPRGALAASMGAYVLQFCDLRTMARGSALLFHSVSIGSVPGGTVDEIEKFAREMRELNHRLAIFASGRLNITLAEFERRIQGDWWLNWEEALEVGAVDGVL